MRYLIFLIIALGGIAYGVSMLKQFKDTPAGDMVIKRSGSQGTGSSPSSLPATGTMYRWRDENGKLHVSTTPPPTQVQAESIAIDRAAEREKAARAAAAAAARQGQGGNGLAGTPSQNIGNRSLNVYTPDGFDQLMNQVDQVTGAMKDRKQAYEDVQGGL